MKTARSGRRVAYPSPCILKLAQATRDDFSMEPDYLAETRKREWLRTSNAGFAAPKRRFGDRGILPACRRSKPSRE
jgi:hypothetical protein